MSKPFNQDSDTLSTMKVGKDRKQKLIQYCESKGLDIVNWLRFTIDKLPTPRSITESQSKPQTNKQ